MKDEFDVEIDEWEFRIEIYSDGYRVRWLNCPDETYPSGYTVQIIGAHECSGEEGGLDAMIDEIRSWVEGELMDS